MTVKEYVESEMPKLGGWLSPEKAYCMAEYISRHEKPEICVEIGVYHGRSLFLMAIALLERGTTGKCYGVDPWSKPSQAEGTTAISQDHWTQEEFDVHHNAAASALRTLGLESNCLLIRSPSQYAAQLFPFIDILHIDGNHSEPASCRDVEIYLPRVIRGGFIFFDDRHWPETQAAIKMLEHSCTRVGYVDECNIYQKP